jgi:hypothetical protein
MIGCLVGVSWCALEDDDSSQQKAGQKVKVRSGSSHGFSLPFKKLQKDWITTENLKTV